MRNEAYKVANERGFRVFPIVAGAKRPAIADWPAQATSNSMDIYEKWADWGAANYGVACGEIVVIDADAHKGGLASLAALGDLPETYTVRTPKGGKHLYFRTPPGAAFSNSVEKLATGIDVRASGGYVVGPGSVVDGKPYVVVDDAPIAPLPAWLAERLNAAPRKTAEPGAVMGELDGPAAIEAARAWLLEAPPAIEGEGGDSQTYATACRVLDFGVSPDTALELMAEDWNERCSPPWDLEELEQKVANATHYRQDAIGRDNPEFGFIEIEPLLGTAAVRAEVLSSRAPIADQFESIALSFEEMKNLQRRRWIVPNRFERGEVTALVAPGGTGKSLWSLSAGAAIALGEGGKLGFDVHEQARVAFISGEDRLDDYRRRLYALCTCHGLDPERFRSSMQVRDATRGRLTLAQRDSRGVSRVKGAQFDELKRYLKGEGFGFAVIDPLIRFHGFDENSNPDMDFMLGCVRELAYETDTSILLPHHTRKPSGTESSGAGDMDTARGASALKDGARVGLTLVGMSDKDAEKYGVPESETWRYIRIDDGKMNHGPKSAKPEWFKKVGVNLPNNESSVALESVTLVAPADEDSRVKALAAIREAFASGKPICCASQGPHAGHVALAKRLGVAPGEAKAAISSLWERGRIKQFKDPNGRAREGAWMAATEDESDA